jgi:ADP-heptose:LPS heptosyltransferase
MNPQTIGKIDRLLGRPLCAALTIMRRAAQLLSGRATPDDSPPRKILFIKMIEQGATVLAHQSIQRAVELVGRDNVYFWVFEENRAILDLMDIIPPENVLPIRAKKLRTFAVDVIRTLLRIRRLQIDATVDMEFFARAPAILAFLTGARRRVGLHRFTSEGPYRGDLLTHRVQYNPYLHTAIAYCVLVESLLADPRERPLLKRDLSQLQIRPPRFVPRDEDLAAVRSLVGADGRRLVLLNPNASDLLPLRKWPTERFVELGRRILAEHQDVQLIITGASGEQRSAERVADAISPDLQRVVSLAGRTSLRELLALYCIADVLVTNDSGPGHFASMTTVDSVVLFGPETPALFGPLGPDSHAIWQKLACSPCVNALNHRFSPCNNNVCMQEISVEQVNQMVAGLLHKRRQGQLTLNVLPRRGVEVTIMPVAREPEKLTS